MKRAGTPKNKKDNAGKRMVLAALGWFLIIISPIVGAIPGPGFIIVFPIGLALVLKNSRWSKKRYVDVKRRFPEYGDWADWALRRKNHKSMPELPKIFRRKPKEKL